MDKKSVKPAPTFGLKSDERAEKKKEVHIEPLPHPTHTKKEEILYYVHRQIFFQYIEYSMLNKYLVTFFY